MKKIFFACTVLLMVAAACNTTDKNSTKSENNIDAARNFIQSALNGDFDKARLYMVDDSLNREDLNAIVRLNERLTPEEKDQYKTASIRIHETRNINDSASVIYYSNSYRNKKDSLKVVKIDNEWKVDFKYIFKHKTDSL